MPVTNDATAHDVNIEAKRKALLAATKRGHWGVLIVFTARGILDIAPAVPAPHPFPSNR